MDKTLFTKLSKVGYRCTVRPGRRGCYPEATIVVNCAVQLCNVHGIPEEGPTMDWELVWAIAVPVGAWLEKSADYRVIVHLPNRLPPLRYALRTA